MNSKKYFFLLSLLIFLAIISRFIGLESSPPGFYADESATAAQILCVSQTGHDIQGTKFPLFSPVLGGGHTTPGFIYGGSLWVKLFGGSIYSLRAFVSFIVLLTILGSFYFASLFAERSLLIYILLSLSLSSWGFHFSRVSWDPPLMPLFLMWGLYFFFKCPKNSTRYFLLSAFCIALSLYSYPPARLQVPLLFSFIFCYQYSRLGLKKITVYSTLVTLFSIPLIYKTLTGELFYRVKSVSLFTKGFLENHGGYTIQNALALYFKNFLAYFSPKLYFVEGDPFIRHSITLLGLLNYAEIISIFCLLYFLLKGQARYKNLSAQTKSLITISMVGVLSAFLTAATTNEYHPHTLRAIGAWPFLSILMGMLVGYVNLKSKVIKLITPILVLAYLVNGYWVYSKKYPVQAASSFDTEIVEKAKDNIQTIENMNYHSLSKNYFLMEYHRVNCDQLPKPN